MPFASPVTISISSTQTNVTHGPYIESPLNWAVSTITSSKKVRKERFTFDIASAPSAGNHVGWLKLGPAIPNHVLDANLSALALAGETITISVAFNATFSEDLHVKLQP